MVLHDALRMIPHCHNSSFDASIAAHRKTRFIKTRRLSAVTGADLEHPESCLLLITEAVPLTRGQFWDKPTWCGAQSVTLARSGRASTVHTYTIETVEANTLRKTPICTDGHGQASDRMDTTSGKDAKSRSECRHRR